MTALEKWKKDFKGYVDSLSMPKDDYNGIIEYIDELEEELKTDVLDKIRAEINGLIKYYPFFIISPYQINNHAMLIEDEVLQIIDKYRQGI